MIPQKQKSLALIGNQTDEVTTLQSLISQELENIDRKGTSINFSISVNDISKAAKADCVALVFSSSSKTSLETVLKSFQQIKLSMNASSDIQFYMVAVTDGQSTESNSIIKQVLFVFLNYAELFAAQNAMLFSKIQISKREGINQFIKQLRLLEQTNKKNPDSIVQKQNTSIDGQSQDLDSKQSSSPEIPLQSNQKKPMKDSALKFDGTQIQQPKVLDKSQLQPPSSNVSSKRIASLPTKKPSIGQVSNIQSSILEQFLNGTPKQQYSNQSSTKSGYQFPIPKGDSVIIPQTQISSQPNSKFSSKEQKNPCQSTQQGNTSKNNSISSKNISKPLINPQVTSPSTQQSSQIENSQPDSKMNPTTENQSFLKGLEQQIGRLKCSVSTTNEVSMSNISEDEIGMSYMRKMSKGETEKIKRLEADNEALLRQVNEMQQRERANFEQLKIQELEMIAMRQANANLQGAYKQNDIDVSNLYIQLNQQFESIKQLKERTIQIPTKQLLDSFSLVKVWRETIYQKISDSDKQQRLIKMTEDVLAETIVKMIQIITADGVMPMVSINKDPRVINSVISILSDNQDILLNKQTHDGYDKLELLQIILQNYPYEQIYDDGQSNQSFSNSNIREGEQLFKQSNSHEKQIVTPDILKQSAFNQTIPSFRSTANSSKHLFTTASTSSPSLSLSSPTSSLSYNLTNPQQQPQFEDNPQTYFQQQQTNNSFFQQSKPSIYIEANESIKAKKHSQQYNNSSLDPEIIQLKNLNNSYQSKYLQVPSKNQQESKNTNNGQSARERKQPPVQSYGQHNKKRNFLSYFIQGKIQNSTKNQENQEIYYE